MIQTLLDMRFEITTVILFCSGFMTLLLHPNLIKKIIGMNIMDTAIFSVSGGGRLCAGRHGAHCGGAEC